MFKLHLPIFFLFLLSVLPVSAQITYPTSYSYDNQGQRYTYTTKDKEVTYFNKYYNIDKEGNPTKHIWNGDTLIATQTNKDTTYINTDHLGSTTSTTNEKGEVTSKTTYYPYGTILSNDTYTLFDEQRKYTGHEYDIDTDLTYANARYYDQDTGRFLSPDPLFFNMPQSYLLDPQQQNPYLYARGNPVNMRDPSGMFSVRSLLFINTAYAPGMHENFTQGITDSYYKINFAPNVDQSTVSRYSRNVIQDSMIKSNEKNLIVTSTIRTPEKQAEIMYNNANKTGIDVQYKLYGSYGDKVLGLYPDVKSMTNKIYELGPQNVSNHIGNSEQVNIFDVAPNSVRNNQLFTKSIEQNININKYFGPLTVPKDTSYHFEIPQKKNEK